MELSYGHWSRSIRQQLTWGNYAQVVSVMAWVKLKFNQTQKKPGPVKGPAFLLKNDYSSFGTYLPRVCFSLISSRLLQSIHCVAVGRASIRRKPISTPQVSQ